MRPSLALALMALACELPAATPTNAPAPVAAAAPVEHADSCRADIPDCEAACALRETSRTAHLEWFDRRCAAVVLGKNPDKAVGYAPPSVDVVSGPAPSASAPDPSPSFGTAAPLPTTRQLPPPPALDPFAGRGGGADPPECTAARSMRAKGKTREADVLSALCSAKGGTESADPKDPKFGY